MPQRYQRGNVRTTKCTTKSDAIQYLRNFEGTKKETERAPLLSELFTRFESMRGNSIRPSTMAVYRLAVNQFKEVCGDRVIDRYSVSDIETSKNTQKDERCWTGLSVSKL